MALYLCKTDPNTRTAKGEPAFIGIVGRVVESCGGYRFLPNVSGRTPSRKVWGSAVKAIPRWADKCGYTELLDENELKARRETA